MIDTVAIALAVGFYTVATIVVGVWSSRQTTGDRRDFYLASGKLKAWGSALSGAASSESGWVMLGLVGVGYSTGVSALWLVPGTIAGYAFNWFIIAPRLQAVAAQTGAVTLTDVLVSRYGNVRPLVWFTSLLVILFLGAYVAAQFTAVGKALNSMFGLDYAWGVAIGVIIVLSYTARGGLRASVWTDVIQATLMIGTLVLLPIVAVVTYGGQAALNPTEFPELFRPFDGNTGFAALGFIAGWAGIGLAYPGQPHVLVRMMGTENQAELRRAGVIAISWSSVVFMSAIAVGMVARLWVPGLDDPESALPALALKLLSAPLAGLALAAVIAAICSTADSQLLVVASVIEHDLARANRRSRGDTLSKTQRAMLVIGIAVIAGIFAASQVRVIFDFVLYAWAALGVTVGPAVIAALFWRRTSATGVVAGMASGIVTLIVWKNVPILTQSLYELIPAFFVALLVTRLVKQRD